MRKISLLIAILIGGIYSCNNEDWSFPDFDYTTTYFPYQYPIRTLVLGDYYFDNQNDNDHKFMISARVGGMYTNHSDWHVEYRLAPELAMNLSTNSNTFDGKTVSSPDTLRILPPEYYTLSPANHFVIPKGSFIGQIEVQLTDAFFDDPLSVSTNYVLPIRITSSTSDSLLVGRPVDPGDPDPRVAGYWTVSPKDFTIFGIKFVNQYHGSYLHRGASVITDNVTKEVIETIVYRQKYVEHNPIVRLQTIGRNTVRVQGTLRMTPVSPGSFIADLTFDDNNNCIITTNEASAFHVSGTGTFVPKGGMWGNEYYDAIHLSYAVVQENNLHSISDTLVFRDKGVTFLEYSPVLIDP